MQNYPIFMDLRDQACLVVGAGPVALRKIRLQSAAGARITVIAPTMCAEIETEFGQSIRYLQRSFTESDVHGYRLITAATNDAAVNRQISELAQRINVPVNVVDQPDLCSFITPSIIDRSPVIVAISTGGSAPVLARMLRTKLEALIPASYGFLAASMQRFRLRLKEVAIEETARKRFWEAIVSGPIAELFFSGRHSEGEAQLEAAIEQLARGEASDSGGEVWLVGAGPGDPDLLTFRALRLMQSADVVLYDRLVSPEILALTRRDAERIYVGKRRADHSVPQPKINELLVTLAQEGHKVLRLKGGDPFIFGRGGEELEKVSDAGIPFQIVPGISAANGCASYAGIPLTHRDHAQSCVFVTGHLKNGSIDLNWQQLVQPMQTVVVYMGLVGLEHLCRMLIQHGLPATTPIALIEQGTTQAQRVFTGTLATLPETIAQQAIQAPTLIIVGSVVSLRKQLLWFEPHATPST